MQGQQLLVSSGMVLVHVRRVVLGRTMDGKANWLVAERALAYLPQRQTGEQDKTPEVAIFSTTTQL